MSAQRTCDGEQPVQSAWRQLGTRWTMAFVSVCVSWDLNIQRQLRGCAISQNVMFMFSQRKFVMFYSFGVIDVFIKVRFSPKTLFLSDVFRENVWCDMVFYNVGKTDARLPFCLFFPSMKNFLIVFG